MKMERPVDLEMAVAIQGLKHVARKKTILSDIELAVECGHVLGILGNEAAGKTIIIEHIMGILKAQAGRSTATGRIPLTGSGFAAPLAGRSVYTVRERVLS
jgi:ABC-type uncharacterized transport system ATPase subunit